MTHREGNVSYLDGQQSLDEKYADKIKILRKSLDARLGAEVVDPV
ncbi:MAG TPA: hypothetical protein VGB85_03605 [Nannocystis sp.]|jgi:hypothetical protein